MRLRSLGPKARICFLFASRTAFCSTPCSVCWCCGRYFGGGEKCCHFLLLPPLPHPPPICPRPDTPRTQFKEETRNSAISLSIIEQMRREQLASQRMSQYTSKPKCGIHPRTGGIVGGAPRTSRAGVGVAWKGGPFFPAWRSAEGLVTTCLRPRPFSFALTRGSFSGIPSSSWWAACRRPHENKALLICFLIGL